MADRCSRAHMKGVVSARIMVHFSFPLVTHLNAILRQIPRMHTLSFADS